MLTAARKTLFTSFAVPVSFSGIGGFASQIREVIYWNMEETYQLNEIENTRELAWALGFRTNTVYYYSKLAKDAEYTEFEIVKKSGAKRPISVPPPELKKLQRAIMLLLEKTYGAHPAAHGGLKKRSIKTNAKIHQESKWIVRVDLENFFGSINSKRIFGLLKQLCANDTVAMTLTNLVTYKGALPQGSPTSPILANMVALRLDKKLTKLAKDNGLRYTRYFDDLIFSAPLASTHDIPPFARLISPDGIKRLQFTRLEEIIEKEEGFKINNLKTRFRKRKIAQYVTGVKVNDRLNLSRIYIRNVRAILHDWERNGYKSASARFKAVSGSSTSFKVAIRGKIEHIGFVRSDTKPKDDEIYKKLLKKYKALNRKGI